MTSKRTYADDPNCLARSSTSSLLRLVPLGPHRLRFRKRVYPDVDELAILELLRRGILLGSEIDTGGGRWIPIVDHPAFEGLIDALGEEIPKVVSEHRPGEPDDEVTRPAEPLPRQPSQTHGLEEESSDLVGDYNTYEQWLPRSRRPRAQPDEDDEVLKTEVMPSDVSLEDFLFDELEVDEVGDDDDVMDATPTAVLLDDRTINVKQPPTAILPTDTPASSPSKPAALRFPIGQTPPEGSKSLPKARPDARAQSTQHRAAPTQTAPPAPRPEKHSDTADIPRPSEVREQPASDRAHYRAPRSASLPEVPDYGKLHENPTNLESKSWPLIVAGLLVLILAAVAAAIIFSVQT